MTTKEIFRKFLISKFINRTLIRPLRKIKFLFPFRYLSRLPIIEEFAFTNRDGKLIKFTSNGYDPTANLLYWSNGNNYEPNIINLLHSLGQEAQVFFDVGANTGVISLFMAFLPFAKEVYAFEPLPRAFRVLNKNINLNDLNNCHTYQLALSESNRESTLYVPNVEAIPTSSSLLSEFCPDHSKIDISVMTMDHFVKTHNISKIDIIKIDVEGGELDVLRGMKSTIENMRPYIICEILPRTGDLIKTVDFMNQFEYYVYEILDTKILMIDQVNEYKRNQCIDFLFSPTKQIDLYTGN